MLVFNTFHSLMVLVVTWRAEASDSRPQLLTADILNVTSTLPSRYTSMLVVVVFMCVDRYCALYEVTLAQLMAFGS